MLTYEVTMKSGRKFTFSAYNADMPAGPMYYAAHKFNLLIWDIDQVSLIDA